MAEYIEKERARYEFALFFQYDKDIAGDCDSLLCMLPAADVVAVVRCKDCKYYGNTVCGYMCKRWEDWLPTEDDDFCSYGERRGEDGH